MSSSFFFFNDPSTTEIYTLSLHDPLPISAFRAGAMKPVTRCCSSCGLVRRSEEHTSELQSQSNLVCRLLLEKKNNLADLHFIPELLFHRDYHHGFSHSLLAPILPSFALTW